MLVSKRAREIVAGDDPLVETNMERPVSIAIDEARQKAITFCSKEEEEAQRTEWEEIAKARAALLDKSNYEEN